ncbi:unnamed protein product [Polarella glacialis]|uniref:BTB domain-containing protein n=1 Tax=Polarella glacialis TaxID=89957 RepID=A0A813LBE5_POLGL|nr:unnamed protein product [Polarella glacialis]
MLIGFALSHLALNMEAFSSSKSGSRETPRSVLFQTQMADHHTDLTGADGQPHGPDSSIELAAFLRIGCDKLLCIQCSSHKATEMMSCHSNVTRSTWSESFIGDFDAHIKVFRGVTYSVLCPDHAGLVGRVVAEGAYKPACAIADLKLGPKRFKTAHLDKLTRRLWDEHERGDFISKCSDGELRAHGCVLAASSPTFSAMVSNRMLESQTSEVSLPDVRSEDVLSMLKFAYTGELSESADYSVVVCLADKYGMGSLVTLCCSRMVTHFNAENGSDYIQTLRSSENEIMRSSLRIVAGLVTSDAEMCHAILRQL